MPSLASRLADYQKEIFRPAVSLQVRFSRFIVIRVLRIPTGSATFLPCRDWLFALLLKD
jgi:hypothetical protein